MNPLSINPMPLLAGAVISLAIGFGAGWTTNGWRLNEKFQAERADRADAVISAVDTRIGENKADEIKHAAINQKIEETKNEELISVARRISDAPRLRVGSAVCPSPIARAPEAESAPGGNAENTGGGLVREDVDRDIRALRLKVEEALATGRACQAFVRDNGLAP